MPLTITNTTKGKLPRLPFAKITEAVLGKEYDCSLVIVGSKKSQELNRTYREKDYPTNILSFPLDKNEGEIFLDLKKAREDAVNFDRSYTNFIGFLFIHTEKFQTSYHRIPAKKGRIAAFLTRGIYSNWGFKLRYCLIGAVKQGFWLLPF